MFRLWLLAGATALAALCACSGGGSSSPAPRPSPNLAGAGSPAVFNQKITFVIDVPGGAAAAASARRRPAIRTAAASPAPTATPIATTPYVSPLTGSVLLTLAEVNGVSPQVAPPVIAPINVPANCQGSTAGCTIPVAGVPAALGVNRYFVQTYTAANATGTLISTGFVDVAVPVKTNPAIGGAAALSIGGFVATITLSPASVNFVDGTPSDADLLVQALDAGGATIVGAAQYATPITVTLNGDTQNFTLNGGPTLTVNGPLQKPFTLHYGGGESFGTQVQATSVNGGGATVSATPIAANVLPPGATPSPAGTASPTAAPTAVPTGLRTPVPTPKPTPTAPPATALSLYVADASADTVSEYRIASQIANGIRPNPAATPSRVIKFDPTLPKSPAIGSGGLSCSQASGATGGNGTSGVTVDPKTGTIFLFPNCTDGTNGFVFGYPPQATGVLAPSITDPFNGGFGTVNGLAQLNGTLYAGFTNAIFGFPILSNALQPSIAVGTGGYSEFGNPSPGQFGPSGGGFGIDRNGFGYIPASWTDTPTGDAAALTEPAAVLAVRATGMNPTPTPFSVITGLNSAVGGNAPFAATVDGSLLYVLTGYGILSSTSGTEYLPGLSACPSPSANAAINPIVADPNTVVTQCSDRQQHMYLAVYSLTGQLLSPSANGTDVDLIPDFLIGGDSIGKFGCGSGVPPGQFLAASGGFVYVINLSPTCDSGNNPVLAPEIDVYNTNGILSGAHTDLAPMFVLPLPDGYPFAVAVGPSGSVSGGQALLRAPRSGPYRPNLYGRHPLSKYRPMLRRR